MAIITYVMYMIYACMYVCTYMCLYVYFLVYVRSRLEKSLKFKIENVHNFRLSGCTGATKFFEHET